MIKTKLKVTLIIFFTCFSFVTTVNSDFFPNIDCSGRASYSYKIEGDKVDGTLFTTGWKNFSSENCEAIPSTSLENIDFTSEGVPDGIFNLIFKSEDRTVTGGPNVMGEHVKGEYKVDTTPVKCVLNTITMYGVDNQYYNNGLIYYKSNDSAANGKFELDITCTDTEYLGSLCSSNNVSCVSGINGYSFPVILGSNPSSSYSVNTPEKQVFKLVYDWKGDYNQTLQLLDSDIFVSDNAGNESKLQFDANTTLKVDGTTTVITGITSLELTPDGTAPAFGITTFKSGNDGNGSDVSIDNSVYFAALNDRKITIPSASDNGSGLRGYTIKVENSNNPNAYNTYTPNNGSNLDNLRVTSVNSFEFSHNFQDVSEKGDYNLLGYRPYRWHLHNNKVQGIPRIDVICDMVDNCASLSNPDFRVVANQPRLSNSPNNINDIHSGVISNFSDTHDLYISFKDKYDNEIVPVSGVKNITLTNNVLNTLGSNQISTPGSGDGVSFNFTDGKGDNIIFTNSNNKFYNTTLNNKFDLDEGRLNIYIKSAVPTYNEYITSANNPGDKNTSMFGNDLSAELKYEKLTIDVNNTTIHNGVGEFASSSDTNPNSFIGKLPDIRFNPILSFNSIGNIFPLVEGQFKKMPILNKVLDITGLDEYFLDISVGTNNEFINVTESKLSNGNQSSGNWSNTDKVNNYRIYDNSYSNFIINSGRMIYNGIDNFEILPQTIGGINNANSKIALYSVLNYITNGKNVVLPGIQTGFKEFGIHDTIDFSIDGNYNSDSSVVYSEIEISGITQTNNNGDTNTAGAVTTDSTTTTFDDFSKITLFDLKTNINKKLSLALKGSNIADGTTGNIGDVITINNLSSSFNSSDGLVLKGGDMIYIKDRDVELYCGSECGVLGKKTIIIENGNLTINSDMYYLNSSSILGLVLVGNTSNGITSKVKINENITNGVGIVYSEGPIVSIDNSGNIYNGANVGNNLYNQLHWKGSFITRNTVGGSINNDTLKSCPYGTPEYNSSSCTQSVAQAYDLIYLRRYARVEEDIYYGTSYYPMEINGNGDNKVPLHYDTNIVKVAGGVSVTASSGITGGSSNLEEAPDSYNAPLIINYDTNIQNNPPYLFEQ